MRGKLMLDPDVRGNNDSVHVVNKTIHLIGVAQSGAEPEPVLAHARHIPYVRRVGNRVLLKDDPRRGR